MDRKRKSTLVKSKQRRQTPSTDRKKDRLEYDNDGESSMSSSEKANNNLIVSKQRQKKKSTHVKRHAPSTNHSKSEHKRTKGKTYSDVLSSTSSSEDNVASSYDSEQSYSSEESYPEEETRLNKKSKKDTIKKLQTSKSEPSQIELISSQLSSMLLGEMDDDEEDVANDGAVVLRDDKKSGMIEKSRTSDSTKSKKSQKNGKNDREYDDFPRKKSSYKRRTNEAKSMSDSEGNVDNELYDDHSDGETKKTSRKMHRRYDSDSHSKSMSSSLEESYTSDDGEHEKKRTSKSSSKKNATTRSSNGGEQSRDKKKGERKSKTASNNVKSTYRRSFNTGEYYDESSSFDTDDDGKYETKRKKYKKRDNNEERHKVRDRHADEDGKETTTTTKKSHNKKGRNGSSLSVKDKHSSMNGSKRKNEKRDFDVVSYSSEDDDYQVDPRRRKSRGNLQNGKSKSLNGNERDDYGHANVKRSGINVVYERNKSRSVNHHPEYYDDDDDFERPYEYDERLRSLTPKQSGGSRNNNRNETSNSYLSINDDQPYNDDWRRAYKAPSSGSAPSYQPHDNQIYSQPQSQTRMSYHQQQQHQQQNQQHSHLQQNQHQTSSSSNNQPLQPTLPQVHQTAGPLQSPNTQVRTFAGRSNGFRIARQQSAAANTALQPTSVTTPNQSSRVVGEISSVSQEQATSSNVNQTSASQSSQNKGLHEDFNLISETPTTNQLFGIM